jgi:hypothetical protein
MPTMTVVADQHGFICNLLRKGIDKSQYREATKVDTWSHVYAANIGCTNPVMAR